jgi:hypothetical protein
VTFYKTNARMIEVRTCGLLEFVGIEAARVSGPARYIASATGVDQARYQYGSCATCEEEVAFGRAGRF